MTDLLYRWCKQHVKCQLYRHASINSNTGTENINLDSSYVIFAPYIKSYSCKSTSWMDQHTAKTHSSNQKVPTSTTKSRKSTLKTLGYLQSQRRSKWADSISQFQIITLIHPQLSYPTLITNQPNQVQTRAGSTPQWRSVQGIVVTTNNLKIPDLNLNYNTQLLNVSYKHTNWQRHHHLMLKNWTLSFNSTQKLTYDETTIIFQHLTKINKRICILASTN